MYFVSIFIDYVKLKLLIDLTLRIFKIYISRPNKYLYIIKSQNFGKPQLVWSYSFLLVFLVNQYYNTIINLLK